VSLIRSLRLAAVSSTARGTFKIDMMPGPPELQGATGRRRWPHAFLRRSSSWRSGLRRHRDSSWQSEQPSRRLRITAARHDAGPVLKRCSMRSFPGQAMASLKVFAGTFRLTVEEDGTHRYELEYDL
jgi:hypothetical protein